MASPFYIGQRLSWEGALCTVRYVGAVGTTPGIWLGVEWDDPSRGRHSGEHEGQWYFRCLSQSATAGSFIRPNRPFDQPLSFIQALHKKYAYDTEVAPTTDGGQLVTEEPITISGKVVEEVGFEKIRQLLATLYELRIVLLDGGCVAGLGTSPWPWFGALQEESVRDQYQNSYLAQWDKVKQTCPNITELDLSRNLLEVWTDVAVICRGLEKLEILKVNGNRLRDLNVPFMDFQTIRDEVFAGLKELSLDDTLLSWDQIVFLTAPLRSLTALSLRFNAFGTIPTPLRTSTLTTLVLASNNFASLSALQPLTYLPSLAVLSLRSNQVTSLTSDSSKIAPIFQSLLILDLSDNLISSFAFISGLPPLFPSLTSLRISQNPVFANLTTEESYILTLARIGGLQILNFSSITAAERINAELYYLGRIAKELSAAPADGEQEILAEHPRYNELCKIHGAPIIKRETDVNDNIQENTLAARLIDFTFYRPANAVGYPHVTSFFQPTAESLATETIIEKSQRIPRTVTPYNLKSVVGKLFALPPAHLKLVWETDEWDPVGQKLGADDEEKWSVPSDEEDEVINGQEQKSAEIIREGAKAKKEDVEREKGNLVKREVELVDGTRQIGFWIDEKKARVRVEVRERTW